MTRSLQKIKKLKERMSRSYVKEDFFSDTEISTLYNYFISSKKIIKSTGPEAVNFDINNPILRPYFDKINDAIGPLEFLSGLFFYTEAPHVIHNDDTFELDDAYKAITIPIATWPENKETNLIIFNQSYFEGPSKFFKDGPVQDTYYNKAVYDYTNIHDLQKQEFPYIINQKILPHINKKWLEGLSVEDMHVWKPGNIIVFDVYKLHVAADFRKRNIKAKLGLSIFTKKDV